MWNAASAGLCEVRIKSGEMCGQACRLAVRVVRNRGEEWLMDEWQVGTMVGEGETGRKTRQTQLGFERTRWRRRGEQGLTVIHRVTQETK